MIGEPPADGIKLHIGGWEQREGWKILDAIPGPIVDYVGNCTELTFLDDESCCEVYASHVFEHLGYNGELQTALKGVYRVLKPGGKVLAVTRARYDVDFWFRTVFFWYGWLGATRREAADVNSRRYSGRGLRRLFHRFIEHRIHKRQLRRSEVPHVWRVLPLPVLARLMGRVLVMKAFKPVSIAISSPALAA